MILFICFVYSFLNVGFGSIASKNENTYYVIHVSGSILVNQTETLKRGMHVKATDKITFKTKDAKAIVISNDKGRYTIAVPEKNQNENFKELMVLLNTTLLPLKKTANLSTRSIGTSDIVRDIRSHLGDTAFFIIGNKLNVQVHPEKYPLNEERFFAIRYIYGGEPVAKKIPFSGNMLLLDKNLLFKTKEGQEINPQTVEKVEVYYHITKPKSSTLLTVCKIDFIDEQELKNEFQSLVVQEKDMIPVGEERLSYFKDFFSQVYGNTDKTALESWLKANNF